MHFQLTFLPSASDASAFLKELDDDLKESAGVRDMCDTYVVVLF